MVSSMFWFWQTVNKTSHGCENAHLFLLDGGIVWLLIFILPLPFGRGVKHGSSRAAESPDASSRLDRLPTTRTTRGRQDFRSQLGGQELCFEHDFFTEHQNFHSKRESQKRNE